MKNIITKEEFLNILIDRKKVMFDIRYSSGGVARLYCNNHKTSYKAGGGGYDKLNHILRELCDDINNKGFNTSTKEIYSLENNYIFEIEIY